MWIFKWVVLFLIITLVLIFSLQNQGQSVELRFMKWESGMIPLNIAIFITFGLGMAAFLLIAVFQQLQKISELSKMKKSFKKLQRALEDSQTEIEKKQAEIEEGEEEKARLRHNAEILQTKLDKVLSEKTEKEDQKIEEE